jgi:VanZ family protein
VIRVFVWLAPVYALALIYFSLGKNHMPPVPLDNADKLYHLLAYLGMTVLWYMFLYARLELRDHKAALQMLSETGGDEIPVLPTVKKMLSAFLFPLALGAAVISLVLGVLLELGQGLFSADRQMDINDVLANTGGIVVAIGLLYAIGYNFRRSKN